MPRESVRFILKQKTSECEVRRHADSELLPGAERTSHARRPAKAVAEGLQGFWAGDEDEGRFVLSQMRESAGGHFSGNAAQGVFLRCRDQPTRRLMAVQ